MGEVLPKNWVETNLGDVSTKPQYGWTSKAVYDGGVKYLRTTDLSKGRVDWDLVPFCLIEPDQVSKYQLCHNDILVSRAGSVGLSYRIVSPPKDAVFASYLIRLKPLINAKYVEFYLQSNNYWQQISDASAGIAVQNINAPKICALRIPVAPLPEQERIANKLDTLFAQIDNVRRANDRIPQLLKNLRQQILTHAVTGKLTAEWRNGNDTEEWRYELASECCYKVQSGGTPKGSKFESSGIPFLKVYNIVRNNIDLESNPQYVSDEIQNSQIKKSILYPGDVVMNIVGPPLNKVAIIPDTHPEWNINQAITLFRPKEYLSNKYLYYFFCEGSPVNSLINQTRGVVGQVNISLSQCRNFTISIPPIEEQEAIVEKTTALFEQLDNIEERYERLTQKLKDLPQSLLHKAFKGELVPQLPTDGSATDLLREIEALSKTIKKK